jgi:anti-sigma regulatory factor (Ser/Thr protein kinase)
VRTAHPHLALFYRDREDYADGVMGFVEPALGAGEPVAIAVPDSRASLLRERLGDSASEVEVLDMVTLGANPARIIPAVERILATHEGRWLHYVGEPIWPGRSPEEIHEATRHEALINLAWPGAPIRVLCPYDAVGLSPEVLEDAERTHPRLIRDGREHESRAYRGPSVPPGCDLPLAAPPVHSAAIAFELQDLSAVRALVSEHARRAGLRSERVHDLVVSVNELATNAVRHGPGHGTAWVWGEPAELICQVQDDGFISDPLAGSRIRSPDAAGGVGLWLVNQLCDLVEVRSCALGTTVRVHTAID